MQANKIKLILESLYLARDTLEGVELTYKEAREGTFDALYTAIENAVDKAESIAHTPQEPKVGQEESESYFNYKGKKHRAPNSKVKEVWVKEGNYDLAAFIYGRTHNYTQVMARRLLEAYFYQQSLYHDPEELKNNA